MTLTEEIEALRISAIAKRDLVTESKCVEALAGDRQARIDCLRLSALYTMQEKATSGFACETAKRCLEEEAEI